MMAFFLTMPISMTTPMMPMTSSGMPKIASAATALVAPPSAGDPAPDAVVLPDNPVATILEAPAPGPRLHLEVFGGGPVEQARVVEQALGLGASHLDIGQRDVPWVVLADPEGNPFCVMEDRAEYAVSGPLSSLPLDSADVERDLGFWSQLSGWVPTDSAMPGALRHPSGRGPLLELCPERRAKRADEKNRVHLDLHVGADRREAEVDRLLAAGATELWRASQGPLAWVTLADPEGNEFCVA